MKKKRKRGELNIKNKIIKKNEIWSCCNNLIFVSDVQKNYVIGHTISQWVEYKNRYDYLLRKDILYIPYDCIIQVWNAYTIPKTAFENYYYAVDSKIAKEVKKLYALFNAKEDEIELSTPQKWLVDESIIGACEIKESLFKS